MKYIRNLLVLVIAIFGFYSVNLQAKTVGDDKNILSPGIERQVRKEILKLPYYGVFDNIAYKVEGDTIILSGKVVQPITKKDAARVVGKIGGVAKVVNNIEVLPLSNFDDSIRIGAYRTFARAGALSRYLYELNPSVRIIVENGHLALEGYVANRGDYNYFNVLARGVTGVFSVDNNLIVESEEVR